MSEFNFRIFSCIHNDIHVMIYIFKQKCIHQQLQRQKLKSERAAESKSQEVREGDTYHPNILCNFFFFFLNFSLFGICLIVKNSFGTLCSKF